MIFSVQMLLQVCAHLITVLIYIDRTAVFIICIYCMYYLCVGVCVVQYMCLCCAIDIVSICANKELYNYNNNNYTYYIDVQFNNYFYLCNVA